MGLPSAPSLRLRPPQITFPGTMHAIPSHCSLGLFLPLSRPLSHISHSCPLCTPHFLLAEGEMLPTQHPVLPGTQPWSACMMGSRASQTTACAYMCHIQVLAPHPRKTRTGRGDPWLPQPHVLSFVPPTSLRTPLVPLWPSPAKLPTILYYENFQTYRKVERIIQ